MTFFLLIELIGVRNGALRMPNFHDNLVRSSIKVFFSFYLSIFLRTNLYDYYFIINVMAAFQSKAHHPLTRILLVTLLCKLMAIFSLFFVLL